MNLGQARAAVSHYAFCGLSREHLGELATELAPQWEARCQSGRRQRRRGDRRCQAGAGPKYALVFTDRLLVTLVHLRTGLDLRGPREDVRGRVLHNRPGNRRDQAASGRTRVRRPATTRPAPARPGRRVRLRRGRKRHTTHRRHRNPGPSAEGRTPRTGSLRLRQAQAEHRSRPPPSATAKDAPCGAGRCGRAGCTTRPRCAPRASLSSSGSEFPDQVSAPPRKPKNLGEGAITEQYGWRQAKRRQSSQRIAVEHATPNCVNGAPCSAGQDAARTTPRHTARSPAWALTAPPNEPPATGQRRCASRRRRSPLHFCQARALPIMVAWRIEVSLRAAQRSDTGCRCSHRGDSWRTPDGSRRRSEGGNRA